MIGAREADVSRRDLGPEPPARDITPERLWWRRRDFIKNSGLFVGSSALFSTGLWALTRGGAPRDVDAPPASGPSLAQSDRSEKPVPGDALTPWGAVTTYNNFYELGLDKSDPAENAHTLRPHPWTVAIGGLVKRPLTVDVDELIRRFPPEERVYRFRCVEAWSMVVPWLGFPLRSLVDFVEPLGSAKYVAFTTLLDPEQLPGQKSRVLEWPYVEGLRLDEARHPLSLVVTGLYGKPLPNQNGAPLRLIVPWKYGFKGIKSIVRIDFVADEPPTSWNRAAPREYGFYANVNPDVDHPRWSQATERRLGEFGRRPTLPFNGYGEQVASLYAGMDLRRFF